MGMTPVTVTVRNPAIPEKTWEGLFLVDTGAVDCLVPRKHLDELGLLPKGQRTYELADGRHRIAAVASITLAEAGIAQPAPTR